MSHDIFRPRTEPAKMLYDAFQEEAKHRPGRSVEEWMPAESKAVWAAARDYSQQNGLDVLLLGSIRDASDYAGGSVDYGAKWAYEVAKLLTLTHPESPSG